MPQIRGKRDRRWNSCNLSRRVPLGNASARRSNEIAGRHLVPEVDLDLLALALVRGIRVDRVRVLAEVAVDVVEAQAVEEDARVHLLALLTAEPADAGVRRLRAC